MSIDLAGRILQEPPNISNDDMVDELSSLAIGGDREAVCLCFDEGADESGGRLLRHDGATHEVEGNKSSIFDLSRVLYVFRPLPPLILSRDEKSLLPPRIRMKLQIS